MIINLNRPYMKDCFGTACLAMTEGLFFKPLNTRKNNRGIHDK